MINSTEIDVVITDIFARFGSIFVVFNGKEKIEAWIENSNKHNPDILSLKVDNYQKTIIVNIEEVRKFLYYCPGHVFKLSLCTPVKRLRYVVDGYNVNRHIVDFLTITEENVLFNSGGVLTQSINLPEHYLEIKRKANNIRFKNIATLPISVLNIGTCFSRSIFLSDDYFNPTYKKFFNVKATLFHNSFVSLFSDKIQYDYTKIEDLTSGDAGKYIGIEFQKNISDYLSRNDFKLIVIDNYIDATSPIIKFDRNSYLTYNKYLSESIFKRFFSSCEVIYPGTSAHLSLYRDSISRFRKILKMYDIRNVILIGGRLCKYKIDAETGRIDTWSDKMDWIVSSNNNWEMVDKLFLEEIPDTIYLDKRHTTWKSDVHSPIFGGASPSHYQREYYKELFKDILQFIGEDFIDEQRTSY